MYYNLLESFFFKNLLNKLTLKGKRVKFLSLIYGSWKNLKLKKLKPNLLFILIISKIKPIFNIYKKQPGKKKRKKKFKVKIFSATIKEINSYKIAINWFLIPFFFNLRKRFKYKFLFEECFDIFLDTKKKNLALERKKRVYFKTLKNKKFFRYK